MLCAKAHKLFDRLDETERVRNPERLRSKDAGDVYRLMATSDPATVRAAFALGVGDSSLADAVRLGRTRVMDIREPLIDLARRHYRETPPEDVVQDAMNWWVSAFNSADQ